MDKSGCCHCHCHCHDNMALSYVFRYSFSEAIPIFFNRLKSGFSLSDRSKIFSSNWLWIEISENVVLSKIDITVTTINKKFWNWEKPKFVWSRPATENPTLGTSSLVFRKQSPSGVKISVCLNSTKTKIYLKP